jgi:hypothetical protein
MPHLRDAGEGDAGGYSRWLNMDDIVLEEGKRYRVIVHAAGPSVVVVTTDTGQHIPELEGKWANVIEKIFRAVNAGHISIAVWD